MAPGLLRFWRSTLVSARTAVVKYSSRLSSYRDQAYDIIVPRVKVRLPEDTHAKQVAARLSAA